MSTLKKKKKTLLKPKKLIVMLSIHIYALNVQRNTRPICTPGSCLSSFLSVVYRVAMHFSSTCWQICSSVLASHVCNPYGVINLESRRRAEVLRCSLNDPASNMFCWCNEHHNMSWQTERHQLQSNAALLNSEVTAASVRRLASCKLINEHQSSCLWR